MNPKVSICIPTYNRKDYLRETLESVFEQTYKDYEVIVLDDGSTDGTEQMIKEASHKARYYWQENAGDAAARNKLIKLASGEYIAFLDSDDLLVPDAIERMVAMMQRETEPVIVYGPYLRIDQYGNIIGKSKRKLYSGFVTKYLFQDILVHSCGSMFPKSVLEETGGFDASLLGCSDYALWLQLSLKYCFIALSKPTFKRRRHSGNISERSFANRKIELDVLEDFYYKGGGKEVIPRRWAMKRLSKEGYRAACCAIKEGQRETARQLFSQSFWRHLNFKSLLWLMIVSGRLYPDSRKK